MAVLTDIHFFICGGGSAAETSNVFRFGCGFINVTTAESTSMECGRNRAVAVVQERCRGTVHSQVKSGCTVACSITEQVQAAERMQHDEREHL
eukprot:scaffold294637_cov33-Tisochrysis_lutea.AAC.2